MLKYFLYCRKSTEDEDRQILSIDAQLSELKQLAAQNGLSFIETLPESMSAKEPGRPIFNDMLRRIERGEAHGIISWKLDRLARNFDDGGKIIGLLQRGVIREIRTFEKTYLPSDNVLMIAVELGMANQYIRDLSVNIRRGYREKIRRGEYPAKAPLGYINEPRLRTIEPHPKYFSMVKRILELFATGKYSLTAIQREFTKAGVVGERSKKPLPLSSIHKLLANPFYYGVFVLNGEMHQGVHVPMISKATFDRMQSARVALAKPRHARRVEKGLLFKNFATCGYCGYCITGERHVKKSGLCFRYYRCTHKGKRERCQSHSFTRDEQFASEVKRNVSLVTIPEEWKERFFAKIETWEREGTSTAHEHLERLRGELSDVMARIDRINAGFTEGSFNIEEFRELKNPLVSKKVELEGKIAATAKRNTNRLEPLRNWISEANTLENTVSGDNWLEMKNHLQKVGSNRQLRDQSLTVSFLNPWKSLAETTIAVRNTAEVSHRSAKWWRPGDSNRRL